MTADYLNIPYLLRVVRIGVVCTFVVIAAIALYPVLDPLVPITHPLLYWGVVVVAPVGAAIVAVLPWPRMLASRWPLAGFHVWSVGDIVLVGIAVVASGGAPSPLWSVYALTTLFFAASYPRRSQIALFVFTVVSYVAAVAVVADAPLATYTGDLILRIGVLATIALMAGFISAELMRQMAAQARRAQASARVSAAAAEIGALDLDSVMDAAVQAAADIGMPISAAIVFEGNTYRVVASRGLPDDFQPIRLVTNEPPESTDLWVLPVDDVADPEIGRLLDDAGCDVILAAPLSFASTRVGLLAAGAQDDPVNRETVRTLGLIVAQAMENAELFRLKTDFVANVSHELRTPLTVLVGMGQTLRRHAGKLTGEQLADLSARIETSATRLNTLIGDLLDFARLDADGRRLRQEPVDVGALVADAIADRRDALAPREVTVDIQPETIAVGDRAMLERIVDNLLDNVVAHTPQTTSAKVTVVRVNDDVEVAVSDDGPGMPPGARVTDRFYRGGDHLTRVAPGLGLGLALAHEILVLHGSELNIGRSELGGALVSFRLPVPVSATQFATIAQPPAEAGETDS